MKTLDIHNFVVSEAEVIAKIFLKECYITREQIVLIIHGHGTYKLKNCIESICINSEYVTKFEAAPPQLGGSGATLVYVKTRRDNV